MNRLSLILFAIIVSLLSLQVIRLSADRGLAWDRKSADLGTVAADQAYHVSFGFRNHASRSLSLRARSCCGIRASIEPAEIVPGGRGTVRLDVEIPLALGDFEKSVGVLCEEVPGYGTELKLKYHITPAVRAVPAQLELSGVEEGGSASGTLRVYRDRGAAAVSRIVAHDPRVKATLTVDRENDCETLTITVACPSGSHEAIQSEVELDTLDTRASRVRIPVIARVSPCASLEPPSFRFGEFAVGSHATQWLDVRGRRSLRSVEVLRSPAWLDVRAAAAGNKLWKVGGTLQSEQSGPLSGEVTLRIHSDHTFDVTVPVTGMAEEPNGTGS